MIVTYPSPSSSNHVSHCSCNEDQFIIIGRVVPRGAQGTEKVETAQPSPSARVGTELAGLMHGEVVLLLDSGARQEEECLGSKTFLAFAYWRRQSRVRKREVRRILIMSYGGVWE